MNLQGGLTTNLSPDGFQTAIDAVSWESYQREQQPGYLSGTDGFFFKQGTTDSVAFIHDESSNVGMFDVADEQEDFGTSRMFVGNQTVRRTTKYYKSIPISDEAFRSDRQEMRATMGKQVGDRARLTRDLKAILNTYGDAFSGNISTTPDGKSLAANDHLTLTGFTVDNLETGALAPDALWTCVTSLANQQAQDGEAGSHVFEGLLIPFTLYKTAKEVMNSTLVANSGENNLNVFDTDYGQVNLKASIFLGSTYNANSNANTSYHLLSRDHMIARKVFYEFNTDLIEPRYSHNDTWELRARFNEMVFNGSWTGYVGSNGSA